MNRYVLHLLLLLAASLPSGCLQWGSDGPEPANPAVVSESDGRYLLTYHILTGGKALFDLSTDAGQLVNLIEVLPETARRLEQDLLARRGMKALTELRDPADPQLRALRRLGYL